MFYRALQAQLLVAVTSLKLRLFLFHLLLLPDY
jgi:hypothetical protein